MRKYGYILSEPLWGPGPLPDRERKKRDLIWGPPKEGRISAVRQFKTIMSGPWNKKIKSSF